MNVVIKNDIKYELGTGGKIKEENDVFQYAEAAPWLHFQRADGSKFTLNTRFIVTSEIREEKSFD